ncbi:MAG: ribonuclease H-like domain-containing protein [bacterium]
MIRGALRHLPGIGTETLKFLEQAGLRDWKHLLDQPQRIPVSARNRERIVGEILRAEQALAEEDIAYFVENLSRRDHWRILGQYFDRASFFDIEISGPTMPVVTAIACYHRGVARTFLRGENLDDFLALLEAVDLLVSFNGDSFDVPMIRNAYRIPTLPCPHLDLRWVCYHHQLKGGLKHIERHLGIIRPPDLQGVDGEEAIWLWSAWKARGDVRAREKLERYCAADAVSLKAVAARVLGDMGARVEDAGENPWLALNALAAGERARPVSAVPAPEIGADQRRMQVRWEKMKSLRDAHRP